MFKNIKIYPKLTMKKSYNLVLPVIKLLELLVRTKLSHLLLLLVIAGLLIVLIVVVVGLEKTLLLVEA